MSCKTESKIINDIEYTCTQFPAIQGMGFKMELASLLGSSLPDILAIASKKDLPKEQQVESFSKAVTKLFESVSPEKLVDLILRITTTGHTKRDGNRITKSLFDEIYAGDNMMEAYKAFMFILQVNYSGFFKGQNVGSGLSDKQGNQ